MPIIEFLLALLSALGFVPALLLALALAPLVQSPLTALLVTTDLALLIEIVQAVIDPEHRFADAAGARLLASALQVALAAWLLREWRRAQLAGYAEAAGD